MTPYDEAIALNAMCLWEEIVLNDDGPWKAYREAVGSWEMRQLCLDVLAPAIQETWEMAHALDPDGHYCFDWEFVPEWLRTSVNWDANTNDELLQKGPNSADIVPT